MHKDITQEERQYLENIMRNGNQHLKNCASLFNMSDKKFRQKLFKSLDIGEDYKTWKGITEKQIAALEVGIPYIQNVRRIQNTIVSAYYKMAEKQSYYWYSCNIDRNYVRHDYLSECCIAIIDAIYGYSDSDASFTTYVWSAIYNRLLGLAPGFNNPFGKPHNDRVRKLLQQFDKLKNSKSYRANDDEIIEEMELSSSDAFDLRAARVRVVSTSQSTKEEQQEFDVVDYRSKINKDEVEIIRKVLEKADPKLTYMEKVCLNAFLQGEIGWQTKVANTHWNDKTNELYSKMAITIFWRKTLEKIKKLYNELLNKDAA